MIRNAARNSAAMERKLKRDSGHKVCFYFNALGFHPAEGLSYPAGVNARPRLSAQPLCVCSSGAGNTLPSFSSYLGLTSRLDHFCHQFDLAA